MQGYIGQLPDFSTCSSMHLHSLSLFSPEQQTNKDSSLSCGVLHIQQAGGYATLRTVQP